MDIPVTLNLLKDKHTSNFEPLASMRLIHQEGGSYTYIVLSYEPEESNEKFITSLKEACAELRSYHVIPTETPDCWLTREEYLLIGFNETEFMICLEVKGSDHWIEINKLRLSSPQHFWLETMDSITEVKWL
jgi:hypothetical protein